MSDNNSTRKLRVGIFRKQDGSPWVYVDLLKWARHGVAPRLIPAFRDLHRIIRAIAKCEDESYPPPLFKGRGRLAEFLHDAVYERDFQRLAEKYQIPERDRDQIVKTNGASVKHQPQPEQVAVPEVTAGDIRWG